MYENRGVSASKSELYQALKTIDKGLYPDAFCKILPDIAGSDDYCFLLHTDTAGTKPALAYLVWQETGNIDVFAGIVEDALVMNLDDMAAAGCISGFTVSANIARNKFLITGAVLEVLIEAANRFINKLNGWGINALLAGGETADVGDIVRILDVGYTLAARMPKSHVIRNRFDAGDVIIGFASEGTVGYDDRFNSGIGCNGLTAARHELLHHGYATQYPVTYDPHLSAELVYCGKYRVQDKPIPDYPLTVGEMLLAPTRTHLPLLIALFDQDREKLTGIIHNTGGGQTKCLHFSRPDLHIVKDNLFDTPLIFQLIETTNPSELYQTFNMGHRLEVYCKPDYAHVVLKTAQELDVPAKIIGRVEMRQTHYPRLTIKHAGQTFIYN